MCQPTVPIVDTAARRAILVDVRRLYARLQAFPRPDRAEPGTAGRSRGSPAYQALEAEIQALSMQYQERG